MLLSAPAGIDDILPEQVARWRFVEDKARELFARYGYSEIRLPLFEDLRVFVHNVGETSDIVEKGMFTFDSGEDHYCLRPEGTAAAVRAYLQHNYPKTRPFQKWHYIGPMFRHERAQKGRKWQFHQLGVEALGASDPLLDAEIIALAGHLFDELGLSGYRTVLNTLGCGDCRDRYRRTLQEQLGPQRGRLCADCQRRMDRNIFRVLDCKQEACQAVSAGTSTLQEALCGNCRSHFEATLQGLRILEIPYEINPRLVRGLDYYTGPVFEFVHPGLGAQSALGAGGRYDNLIAENGGPALGGAGFALGLERILIALEALGQTQALAASPALHAFLVSIGPGTREPLFQLAGKLRRGGLRVDLDHEGRSVKAQMRSANRSAAPFVLVLGCDELAQGQITLKRMDTGQESKIPLDSVLSVLRPGAADLPG
ncbi:MAG: histidine--tRNA ligase [Planctomycetes bacterium]|nr:histidine--tRNA ligase [Planctomycetota bacterium]